MTQPVGVPRPNPFSPVAVARTGLAAEIPVTVLTPSIEAAASSLTSYLNPPSGTGPNDGAIVAIVGDYGTGKTHLAIHLLRQAERAQRAVPNQRMVVHHMYLEASPSGFQQVYEELLAHTKPHELLETLRDYYANIVADALAGSEYTQDVAGQLRAGIHDPESVVESLGLMESQLVGRLRAELIRVTKTEAFGIAMTLLLRREEFAEDVWGWLSGRPPTPALARRGIEVRIASEEMAVTALGAFAHLYGRHRHRFVLVIDEMQRILTNSSGGSAVSGAKRLFEVFGAAGGFLVVVGLPDLFDLLGQAERERVIREVDMNLFDAARVRQLIELTQRHMFGVARLKPFTETAPDRIARLTDGTARQVVRLCHRAYQTAIDRNIDQIDDEIILAAARSPEAFPTLGSIRGEIRRELNKLGLRFEQHHLYQVGRQPIDFWISEDSAGPGCALILTEMVVKEEDADRFSQRAHDIQARYPGAQVLLVVVGYLDSVLRSRLTGFSREPIQRRKHGFDDALTGAITSALKQIDRWRGKDDLGQLRDRVDQIHRQQNFVRDAIDRLEQRLAAVALGLDQLPEAIRREVREERRATPENEPHVQPPALPEPVEHLFQEAFQDLARFASVESDIQVAMRLPPSAALDRRQRNLFARMNRTELYPAVGAASLLRCLVQALRSAVTDFYQENQREPSSAGDRTVEERLSELCARYEDIHYHLLLSRLDDYPVAEGASSDDQEWGQAGWLPSSQEIRERFRELGRSVREVLLPLLTRQIDG